AVRGPLSVDQALEQALRGSGLQFRRSERGAVISAAPLRAPYRRRRCSRWRRKRSRPWSGWW
ncbi:STN domain-containing protein, partial [Pseudomonas aeruginosa]|nr:STN domain-containing protein [Pseudomonas aeruginosa]